MASGAARSPGPAPRGGGLGIYGGSFNPPHTSHVRICRLAAARLPIHELLVIPSGDHPHKRQRPDLLPAADRLAMARLAFDGLAGVRVDDRELHRDGPSFTVDTLAELASEYPGRQLFFLIGSDNLPLLPTWHEHHRLLQLATVVTYPRQGHPVDPQALQALDLTAPEREQLLQQLLEAPADAVSSSDLRRRLRAGEPTPELAPAVRRYIDERNLYR